MHPSPLQCPGLWWGTDVPFDALHRRDWVAARSHGLPGPIHPLTPQSRAGMIPVLLAHPVPAWLLRLSVSFFLVRCLGRAASQTGCASRR